MITKYMTLVQFVLSVITDGNFLNPRLSAAIKAIAKANFGV